jgi:hypothetical protein
MKLTNQTPPSYYEIQNAWSILTPPPSRNMPSWLMLNKAKEQLYFYLLPTQIYVVSHPFVFEMRLDYAGTKPTTMKCQIASVGYIQAYGDLRHSSAHY